MSIYDIVTPAMRSYRVVSFSEQLAGAYVPWEPGSGRCLLVLKSWFLGLKAGLFGESSPPEGAIRQAKVATAYSWCWDI